MALQLLFGIICVLRIAPILSRIVVYRLLKSGIWNPPFDVFRNVEDDGTVNESDAIEPTSDDYLQDERRFFVWSGRLHVILKYFYKYKFT